MIALTLMLLRSFASDRTALTLAFIAPIAFFSIFAVFFRHLDAPDGVRIEVAVVVQSDEPAARLLADACVSQSGGRIAVTRVSSGAATLRNARWSAAIEIPSGFDPRKPTVEIESMLPLPGTSDAIRQLVAAGAAATASASLAGTTPPVEIVDRTRHGALMRASAPGIPVLFMLVALSSLAARGLGDDEAGFSERLLAFGISPTRRMAARIASLAVIGFAQLAATLLFAAIGFGLVPASPSALAAAAVASALSCAAFVVLLAAICGNRSRFAAIAPVCTLSLSGLGGSMVPISLLPDSIAWPSRWIFTGWSIDACMRAIDGTSVAGPIAALAATTVAFATTAAIIARRSSLR